MVAFDRRTLLRAGISYLGVSFLGKVESLAETLASLSAGRKKIQDYITQSKGKSFLEIGNLALEIVEPKDTGAPLEYQDPCQTGVPIVRVPIGLLEEKISQNFVLGEFSVIPLPARNKGTGLKIHEHNGAVYHQFIRLDPRLVESLQEFRLSYGRPLKIISPYRNFTYNKKCGGKGKSRHMAGQAADLQDVNDNSARRLAKLNYLAGKHFSDGGVGYYPRKSPNSRFVHVDVRGTKARWTA